MSNYPKYFLTQALSASGDMTIPPATASEAGEGRLSQEKGWGSINSQPLENGGIAPFREDFNGMMYLVSQFLLWYQQGGVMNYSSKLPYEEGNEVLLNGVKYRALKANGGSNAAVVPGTDASVWRNLDANVPAGAVMPFANVKLGGSDGRRPIFWGATAADEGWVLCDGGTAYGSVNAPNLVGRFIRGVAPANAGQTGGTDSVTLGAENMPAHTHTVTLTSAGAHTHTRGSMEISGTFDGNVNDGSGGKTGAFYYTGTPYAGADGDSGARSGLIGFKASRNWTGSTSSNGSHTHTATCSSAGGSGGKASAVTTTPPYYTLAYFVKLPEA